MRLPILAALSAGCVEDGTPPVAPGVQFGDEGVLLCVPGASEPWDPDVVPDGFAEAPSVTRDRALGAWTAEGTRSVVGAPLEVAVEMAVDIAATEEPFALVDLVPQSNDCGVQVLAPVVVSVDGADLVATFPGVLELGPDWWIVRTVIDGSDAPDTLVSTLPTPIEDLFVRFEAGAFGLPVQGTGPMNGAIVFATDDDPPSDTVVAGTSETWAAFTLDC